ncbi:hypothetical protein SUDANB145_02140 [Streptomyces sp. enrichment culture]|uniref:hypothetical protein n=1 Tax=Streptomyces sp. enrichment culture TaxID=1795815 RepID=UPI003F564B42
MGTKTVDETGAATKADEDRTDVTDAPEAQEESQATEGETEAAAAAEAAEETEPAAEKTPGVGQGAGAVVSAALGVVSLTGSWTGTIASAKKNLLAQLESSASSSSSVQTLLERGYGDAWHATALWSGLFALFALLVGVVVLVRPAFGAPGRPQAPWIKSVSWAGVVLGVIGLLLAVLTYTDILLAVPSVS